MSFEMLPQNEYQRGEFAFDRIADALSGERAVSNKFQPIPYRDLHPHYSDDRFFSGKTMTAFLAEGQVVQRTGYGSEEVEGAHYVYSDRFAGHERWTDKAFALAKEKAGNDSSASFYEELLRDVLEDPTLSLSHIITGVNVGNGFDYQVFGYTTEKKELM